MAEPSLIISAFDKALHDRRAFSCGVEPMDRWLRESALEQIKLNRLRLWCATNGAGDFVGFYALSMHSVLPKNAPTFARRNERNPIPAIYLVALAVDGRHQGRGVGGALMADAILRSVALSREIGAAAIILDVLKYESYESRRAFYLQLGFAEIGNGDAGRLYLSIKDAEAAVIDAKG